MTNVNTLFDLKKFLDRQYSIYKKFVPPTLNGTDLEKFDKLLINLIEEMYEYNVENDKEEKKNELVDVIMYTGTCISVWMDTYGKEINTIIERSKIYPIEVFQSTDILFHKHYMELIGIRRNFSERKWHKPIDKNQNTKEYALQLVITNLIYLKHYINNLCFLDSDVIEMIRRIDEKQKFILNLPLQQ